MFGLGTKKMGLGNIVRDKITGFEGTLIGRATYIFGCDQCCVAPQVKEGAFQESRWFDDGRLDVISEGINAKTVTSDKPGGPDRGAPTK